MKKFLSLILALCMVICLAAPAAYADAAELVVGGYWGQSGNPDDHLKGVGNTDMETMPEGITNPFVWKLYSDGLLTFEAVDGADTIAWIDSKDRTPWYANYSDIKKVVFPEGVKEIGANIFSESSVVEVVFPESCTSIGSAFAWCRSLSKVNIPKNLKSLAGAAFAQAKMTSVALPETLDTIESNTFLQSGLKSATINGSDVKESAFNNCHGLETLKLYGDTVLRTHASVNNISLNKVVAGPEVIIEDDAFVNEDRNPMLPNAIYGVKGSPAESFALENNITFYEFDGIGTTGEAAWEVVDTVLTISGEGAMADYEQGMAPWYGLSEKIRTVVITDGVTEVGDNAFYGLSSVKNAIIADSVTKIGAGAFAGCSKLSAVLIPDSVTVVEDGAFSAETAACVSGSSSFANAEGFKTYTAGVEGDEAINYDGQSNISWAVYGGDTLVVSGQGSMRNSYKDDIVPWNDYAASLKTAVVDYGITNIVAAMFNRPEYTVLETIIIADGVERINYEEIAKCPALLRYDMSNTITSIAHYVVNGNNTLAELNFPGSLSEGRGATIHFSGLWGLQRVTFEEGFNYLATDASDGQYLINGAPVSSLVFPTSVTKVGSYSFRGLYGLTRLEFLNPDTVISDNAFVECSSNVTVVCAKDSQVEAWAKAQLEANKIKAIETYIGKGNINKDLTWFVAADGELLISGTGAMEDYESAEAAPWADVADKITKINVANGVTSIGAYAFANMPNAVEASIAKDVLSVGENAFLGHNEALKIVCESDAVKEYADANSIRVIIGGTLSNNTVSWKIDGDTLTVSGSGEIPGSNDPWDATLNETPWVDTAVWQNDIRKVIIEDGITKIPATSFATCFGLEVVVLPDTITWMGNLAFHRSVNLEFLEIPENGTFYDAIANPSNVKRTVIKNKGYNRLSNLTGEDNFKVFGYEDSEAYAKASELGIEFETIIAEGQEGSIEWVVTNAGTLDIYGVGDLAELDTAPWAEYASTIKNVYIEEGISGLGANLFSGINNAYIELPDEITALSENAITATNTTVRVPVYVKNIVEGAFDATTTIWSYKNSEALAYAEANNLANEERESLRILALGNSYTQDSTMYLWNIANECGAEDVVVGRMYHAGARLFEHLRAANNEEGYENFYLYTEQTAPNGEYSKQDTSFDYGLTAQDWDIIVIQAWYPEACYGLNGEIANPDANVFDKEWLNELTEIIKERATNENVELGFNMIWSQERQLSEAIPNDTANGNNNRFNDGDTLGDWQSIVYQTNDFVLENDDYTYLIPVGTAVENARTSYLAGIRGATSASDLMGGLQRDSVHLNDIGKYIAAMTWAKVLKPEWDVAGMSYAPDVTYAGTDKKVIDEDIIKVSKEAVSNAVKVWNEITPSAYPFRIMSYENSNVTVAASNIVRNVWGVDNSIAAELVFAEYTPAGKLVKVTTTDATLIYDEVISGESTELHNQYMKNIFSDNGFSVASGNAVKVMLVDSVSGLKPLSNAF